MSLFSVCVLGHEAQTLTKSVYSNNQLAPVNILDI